MIATFYKKVTSLHLFSATKKLQLIRQRLALYFRRALQLIQIHLLLFSQVLTIQTSGSV